MTQSASNPSEAVLDLLRHYESRNITFLDPDGSWPIVWRRARGTAVWDARGRKYLDLTAAFGVAAAGHANPRVVRAGQRQMAQLLHAMGDVHPHPLKGRLVQELSRITFERWTTPAAPGGGLTAKTILCNSGFEAVEAALKTAFLATGRPGVIAFEGGYHGLGYGALNATHRTHFRGPFRTQLGQFGHFAPFPSTPADLEVSLQAVQRLCRRRRIGAILVEPIQVRGGINIPPADFLPALRRICNEQGGLLILDEIYTGFGRTGQWFACEHSAVVPDLICLGKALTGGFPLSACVGRASIMDAAWPVSTGEAIHTSTFLGHPVGCAMALAQIAEMRRRCLPERGAFLGERLLHDLRALLQVNDRILVRGRGLLVGLELRGPDAQPDANTALAAVKSLLKKGFILLPEGEHGHVISLTPPLTISERELARATQAIAVVLNRPAAP